MDRSDLQEQCLSAARGLQGLSHPNIVGVYACGVDQGRAYVVTEPERGVPLTDIVARGRLEVAQAVSLMMQICEGLSAAHDRGVLHRDVKPESVLVVDGAIARVADFGLPCRLGDVTGAGSLVGTPAYTAPEVSQGQPPDERTDVYAAGVVLFQLLTGRVPFVAEHPTELPGLHILQPAPRVSSLRPEVPRALDDLVARALAKQASARPRDAIEFANAMRRALGPAAAALRPTPVLLDEELLPPPPPDGPGWVMGAMMVGVMSVGFSIALVLALVWATGAPH